MAENAWYEKHKKDVAVAIKRGRGAAKDDGVPCTLVKMKDGSALLCAHVSGSKAAALVKEAKGAGGKVLSSGTLYKGDDGPTFGVTDGSISVKMLFSSAAAEAAGSPLNVIVVAVTPAAEAAAAPPAAPPAAAPPAPPAPPAAASPAAPPVPPPPAAPAPAVLDGVKGQFTDLLRSVRPRFQQAIAADPPNKANLEKGMGMAVAAAKENDFGKGLKVLQALDAALQKTPAAAVPPPPPMPGAAVPPAPAMAPPPAPAATAAIQAALTKMIPLVKSTAAANPARKTELMEPLKRCQDHLKSNQAAEAKAALFDLNRVIKELAGAAGAAEAAPGAAIPPAPTAPPFPADSDAMRFKARLLEVKGQFDRLKEKDPARAEALGGLLAAAANLARNKEFADGLLRLEELAKALEAASVTAPSADDVKGETEAEEAETEEPKAEEPIAGKVEAEETEAEEAETEEPKAEEPEAEKVEAEETEAEEAETEEAEEDLVAALDVDEDVVERVSLVGLGKARLNWEAAKKQVQGQLDRLEKAIRAEFQDQEGAAAVKNLSHILENFNEGLSERIDDLLNADGEARRRLAGEARAVNVRYLEFVAKSPLINHVEAHPFDGVKVTVRDLLQRPLKALSRQLPAALA